MRAMVSMEICFRMRERRPDKKKDSEGASWIEGRVMRWRGRRSLGGCERGPR